ncbi:MAG: acyl carrier protein [Alphaproteobacteria bacterium]
MQDSQGTPSNGADAGAGAGAVHPELAGIFADVFQYTGDIKLETSPDDVERWDSLRHIALVTALEDAFSISLSMDEMMEIHSVGDIQTVLARHGV